MGGAPCPVPPNCLSLGDGGPATGASLAYPLGVAADRNGNLFIADSAHALVRKVTPDGTITTIAGNGKWPAFGAPVGGPAADAAIGPVYSVAIDDTGNLFIATGSLLKVSTDGLLSALHSGLATATSVAVDRSGNLYVSGSQCDNNPVEEEEMCWGVIERFNPNGGVTPIAGSVDSTVDASAMVVTATGDLLITGAYRGVVSKIDSNGIITTIAGTGSYGYSGDGGAATKATLSYATGLALDGAGTIYVSDVANGAVRVLRPSR